MPEEQVTEEQTNTEKVAEEQKKPEDKEAVLAIQILQSISTPASQGLKIVHPKEPRVQSKEG